MDVKTHTTTRTTVVILVDLDESPDDVLHGVLARLERVGCGSYELAWTQDLKALIISVGAETGWVIDPESFHDDLGSFLRYQRGMLHDDISLTHNVGEGDGREFEGHDWRLEFTVEHD